MKVFKEYRYRFDMICFPIIGIGIGMNMQDHIGIGIGIGMIISVEP